MAIILITGASGQLGNELRVASRNYYGYQFVFTDIEQLDITSGEKTAEFVKDTGPDWIINCAAYNFVDKAENEQDKAMLINRDGIRNIVETIKGTDCKFIHFSTDYVFDGNSPSPYNENSVTSPGSTYGLSKLAGEKAALQHHNSMIIRTSWLYSSFGSNFVRTILAKASENQSLRVVFDQTGTPTYARDLAEAVLTIVSGVIRNQVAFYAGIYHYSNEGVCSWYDFAEAIVTSTGSNCKIIPVLTKDYPVVAKRPVYSVLDKTKIKETYSLAITHWRESLVKCIKLLK